MALRRYFVRRHVGNSDRVVVLPDNGGPASPRRGDYDDYDRPRKPHTTPSVTNLDGRLIPEVSRGPCPSCGRIVRFNLARNYYYSHTLPGSTSVCELSGRD